MRSIFNNNIECTNGNVIAKAFGEYFSEIAVSQGAEIP